MVAFDSPQGLKDTIITQQDCGESNIGEIVRELEESDTSNSDDPSFCKLKEVARESEIGKAREMSLMVTNSDNELVNRLSRIPCVLNIETHRIRQAWL